MAARESQSVNPPGPPICVAWPGENSDYIAVGCDDGEVVVRDARNGEILWVLEGHVNGVQGIACSPDGTQLASASNDKTLKIWDPKKGINTDTLEGHGDTVRSVVFNYDGSLLASASYDGTVKLWDPLSGELLTTLEGHNGGVIGVSFNHDGSLLASASTDGVVKLWDPVARQHVADLEGHTNWVVGVDFSRDGSLLASASYDGVVKLWDPVARQHVADLEGHTNWVRNIAYSYDGTQLASVGNDSTVRLWGPVARQQIAVFEGHSDTVRSAVFDPDGSVILSASDNGIVKLWDSKSGQQIAGFEGHASGVVDVSYHPERPQFASASYDGTVKVWDSQSGELLVTLMGHARWVRSVAFSPDGTQLASGSDDETVKVWDSQTRQQIVSLNGHSDWVFGVAFSPDGRQLASACNDKTVKVWDPWSGNLLSTLTGHTNSVRSVAYHPDGSQLVTTSNDGTIKLWDLQTETDTTIRNVVSPSVAPNSSFTQVPDNAALDDFLNRGPLAHALASQLQDLHANSPEESFSVHISGAWGSGKSSIANFLVDNLQQRSPDWVVPKKDCFFDAWRETQVGPAWWSLLGWLRQTIKENQPSYPRRCWFVLHEWFRLVFLSGLAVPAFVGGVLVIGLVAISIGYRIAAVNTLISVVGTGISVVTSIVVTSMTVTRFFTWRSPVGARLFERQHSNPMEDVTHHVNWLRRQSSGPIVLVLDDVDRCPASFVVELLEAVQTLFRSKKGDLRNPLIVVVCADDRWLQAAFESTYSEFVSHVAEPSRSLGQLFIAKLFQLRFRVPVLDNLSAQEFARTKLGLDSTTIADVDEEKRSSHEQVAEKAKQIEDTVDLDEKLKIFHQSANNSASESAILAAAVGRTAITNKTRKNLEHELQPYIELVDFTPRGIVRFINAYTMARLSTGLALTSNRPTKDSLARWTIIELRWPQVAQRLSANPELMDQWHRFGCDSEDPDVLTLRSKAFHQVVLKNVSPALTTEKIRKCII